MPYSDPDRARDYQRQYRRIRRSGDGCTTPVHPTVSPEFRLQTTQNVIDLLEEQVAAVRADSDAAALVDKARALVKRAAGRLALAPPNVKTVREWIRQGYRPLGYTGEPVYLKALRHGRDFCTTAAWCLEFEEARLAISVYVPPARRRPPPARGEAKGGEHQ